MFKPKRPDNVGEEIVPEKRINFNDENGKDQKKEIAQQKEQI